MLIEVRRRLDDWHAQIYRYPELWGCGRSVDEAVGNLVTAHAPLFNVVVQAAAPSVETMPSSASEQRDRETG
jgi:hypothetical protein